MDIPELEHLSGKGLFLYDNSSVESAFVLSRTPHWIGILAEEETLGVTAQMRVTVQLSGYLNDGRPVKAASLYCTKTQPVELTAVDGLFIGQERDISPAESRFPLTGYFDGAFTLDFEGWNISAIPCQDSNAAQAFSRKWRCPIEGVVLQLRHKNKNVTAEEHRDFARVIMILLSLASGTGVTCQRHFLSWDNEVVEMWRHMTGDEIGPGAIIPPFEVKKFLEQALPAWHLLSQNRREVLRLAISYINLSAEGYLDSRLFNIVQPWEFLAEAWEMHGILNKEVSDLSSRLQQTRKKWNKDYPNSDPHGFWGSRISSIFEWPKLRDSIERLSSSVGLDLEKIGLNLDMLKEARDGVAHSGKLPSYLIGSDKQAFQLLSTGQYGLQLLLLRLLAYQGLVYHSTNGWLTHTDINDALTKMRT